MQAGVLAAAIATGGLMLAAPPDGARLPFWRGELSGRLHPLGETGPVLTWTLTPRMGPGEAREMEIRVADAGTQLRVRATFAGAAGDGHWAIEEGTCDLGPWAAALLPRLGELPAGTTLAGRANVTGEGVLRGGSPEGNVRVEISDATLRNEAGAWSLHGIGLRGEFAVTRDLSVASVRPVELTIRQVTTTRFGLSNVLVTAALEPALTSADPAGRRVAVRQARLEAAGGHVEIEPFSVDLARPELDVKMTFQRVGLQDVVALVPESLSEASGRVDGEITARWSEAEGFRLGDGWLALNPSEATTLRLTRSPGLLTAQLPERVITPTGWLAWLSRVVPRNPAYQPLKDLELGRTRLRVKSLRVSITPQRDAEGRTARVEVVTHPDEAGLLPEMTFNIRVGGPLEALLQLGMNDQVKLGLEVGVP